MDSSERCDDSVCESPFLRGSLEVENHGPMDCIVIDHSNSGARVALADMPSVGDYGLLTVPARYFLRACKVVQRGKDDTFCLAFMPVTIPNVIGLTSCCEAFSNQHVAADKGTVEAIAGDDEN